MIQPPISEKTGDFFGSGTPESDFLAWVSLRQAQAMAMSPNQGILHAAGDDLAVLHWRGGLVLLGVDPVLDGVHVEITQHGAAAAGRKAMNRNLSDVAAMGAEPVAATLSLVVPKAMSLAQVKDVYLGAEEAGANARCPIVGGDFASWDGRLVATVSILARAQRPILRGSPADGSDNDGKATGGLPASAQGALRLKAGQTLFVTGPLGGSILGRHLTFTPRLEMGRRIALEFAPSAMIDISDGLSIDLPRLLGDKLGATIDAAAVPIHQDARRLARQSGREPLWHALNDGEDYELLFAAEAKALPDCIAIGRVESEPGVRILRDGSIEPLKRQGWEHRLRG